MNTTTYGDMSEAVTVTPSDGWLRSHGQSAHDYAGMTELHEKPITVSILLNQGIVFQKQGHYEISVTTNRVVSLKGGLPLTTNTLAIDLVAPDETKEADWVRWLSNKIAAEHGAPRHTAAAELAYLGGDDAVRAKVRWLAEYQDRDSVQREMLDGLASSRNLELQLNLLQTVWRDVQHVPDSLLLDAMQQTRAFMRNQTLDGWQMMILRKTDPASLLAEQERQRDVTEIVASLPQRTGINRRDTAYFLMEFSGMTKEEETKVLPVVLDEFRRMDPLAQAMLLETRWKNIKDPSLVPYLQAILDTPSDSKYYGSALQRLIELSPETAKPYVIREICNPASRMQMKQVADLPQIVLPEVDTCLESQLRVLSGPNNFHMQQKSEMAARFSTEALLPVMLQIYRAKTNWTPGMDDGPYIAYFLRYSPKEAMQQIEALGADSYVVFFETDTIFVARKAHYPEELLAWFRLKLESGSDADAGSAAYRLSLFGEASDKLLVEKRLEKFHVEWAGRGPELETAAYNTAAIKVRGLEVNLVSALVGSNKVWTLSPEEKAALSNACLTSQCKKYVH
ncbi:MAG TPA: hypothetical protein VGZ48_00265 [Candidatus Acidoferrales bacterium]|nr:hypothetical protein [Candidatus Acidoferrales bacterium]